MSFVAIVVSCSGITSKRLLTFGWCSDTGRSRSSTAVRKANVTSIVGNYSLGQAARPLVPAPTSLPAYHPRETPTEPPAGQTLLPSHAPANRQHFGANACENSLPFLRRLLQIGTEGTGRASRFGEQYEGSPGGVDRGGGERHGWNSEPGVCRAERAGSNICGYQQGALVLSHACYTISSCTT